MAALRFVLRRWPLVVPAVFAPVAATAILLQLGPSGAASMGPQVSAPPPFDIFHDLRWISVYHNSWAVLSLELVGVICLRSLWTAWVVRHAWPDRAPTPPPGMPPAFLRALAFYAVAAVLLAPFVIVLFGLAIVHLSYLFFAALPPVLVIALVMHRGALSQAAGQWWRWHPSWGSLAWLAGAFVWLSAMGAAISVSPWPVALVAAAVGGALNARADVGIVSSIVQPRRAPARLGRRLVPVALMVTFVIVAGGVRVGFAVTGDGASRIVPNGTMVPAPGTATGHPVLVAAGNNSRWDPRPPIGLPEGFVGWRYSYRGMDERRRPLAYGPQDTLQSLLTSAGRMAEQVDALYRAYREPVTLLGESEGALVAATYLIRLYQRDSGTVDRLVVFDLPPSSASVYYPTAGSQGWGVGSGWGLRGLTMVVRALTPLVISADAPFIRDLVDCRALVTMATSGPPPEGVRQVSIRALADAVDGPAPRGPFVPDTYVITAPHGGLVTRKGTEALIGEILDGTPSGASVGRLALARLITAVSDPWQTPNLLERFVPARTC